MATNTVILAAKKQIFPKRWNGSVQIVAIATICTITTPFAIAAGLKNY